MRTLPRRASDASDLSIPARAEEYVSMRFRRLGNAHPITRKQITSELSKIKKQSEALLKGLLTP